MNKLIAKALMPLLVDKKARERMARKEAVRDKLETMGVNPDDPEQVRKVFKKTSKENRKQNTEQEPPSNPELGFDIKDREALLAALRANKARMEATERRKLIRNAQELRRAKTHVLNELSDEQRDKLQRLAMRAMLGKKH